ncbi:MAG TPA: hypothetical protein VLN90_05240, partial [Thioalkalivibrio sp.]|nr:hypothetical protein [Thioalkalivibrio sp.]
LVGVTGLVLTLQNPQAQDSAAELISRMQLPDLSQVIEMRPQTPPPVLEGDQLIQEEVEDVQLIVPVDREHSRSRDLRKPMDVRPIDG